ncbi:MAG TPA: TetR/AcrR family transcriptional regulator [Streptosporangiaceae bacterium]|nr:TetR/AcrR family transcriptional regulator [Streptosporangiaceae bacterium]
MDDEMPGSVAAAWGVKAHPGKGPKPGLTLDRIVAAAIGIASRDGLPAVSMSRVAAALGASTMSLYRYVDAKDELVKLMVDAAWGPPPAAAPPGEGWRGALSRWAWGMRAAFRRHPWAVRIPISGLPIMPNEVAWFEQALAGLGGSGLEEAEKASVIMLVSGYVRTLATTEADIQDAIRTSGATPDEWMAAYPRMLAKLADPGRFPALTTFIAAGVFDRSDDPDDEFTFGLERILDGVGALVRGRVSGR